MTMTQDNELQSGLEPKKVSDGLALDWIKLSTKLCFENYAIALGISFVSLVFLFVSKVPIIGVAIYYFCSVPLAAGVLIISKSWLEGRRRPFADYFMAFNDTQMFKLLTPLAILRCIIMVGISILYVLAEQMPLLVLPVGLLGLIVMVFDYMAFFYGIPLVVFHKLPPLAAIKLSFAAVNKNLWVEFLNGTFLGVYFVLSLLALAFPVFFVFLPAMLALCCIKYMSIFENFDVEKALEMRQNVSTQSSDKVASENETNS